MDSYRLAYGNIHHWLQYKYGSASICENNKCIGTSKKYEWALKKGKSHDKKRENYLQLCKSCHVKYDYGTKGELSPYYKKMKSTKAVKQTNIRVSWEAYQKISKFAKKKKWTIVTAVDELVKKI